jgi:hypothetical protein
VYFEKKLGIQNNIMEQSLALVLQACKEFQVCDMLRMLCDIMILGSIDTRAGRAKVAGIQKGYRWQRDCKVSIHIVPYDRYIRSVPNCNEY